MTRVLFILVVLVVALSTYIVIKGAKESYKVLPGDLSQSLKMKPFEDWREFTSKEKSFSVMLPNPPQHASESVPASDRSSARKYNMYVSEKDDGTIFMISLITYLDNTNKIIQEGLLENIMDEMMASSLDNQLVKKSEGTFQKHRTLDFVIQNKDLLISSKAFIFDQTLYLLTYIAKNEKYNISEYHHFIDSFHLTLNSQIKE